MPAPSTGSVRSARAFLRRFGRNVLILDDPDPDTNIIKGIYRNTASTDGEQEIYGVNPSERRYVHRLWVAEVFMGNFPGGITNRIVINPEIPKRAMEFFIRDYQSDTDDWIEAHLSIIGPCVAP